MGDFWDDIKKKNEERRIAGIKSDIRVLEEQIKEYEDAKKKVLKRSAIVNAKNGKKNWEN